MWRHLRYHRPPPPKQITIIHTHQPIWLSAHLAILCESVLENSCHGWEVNMMWLGGTYKPSIGATGPWGTAK